MPSLTDERRAIVIGGTHGIGLAIAEQLVHAGARVVITGRDPSKARADEAVILAAKAAVRAFSRSLAADLVGRGVRVNTVAPGFIDTPTLGVAGMSDAERSDLERAGRAMTPMGRRTDRKA